MAKPGTGGGLAWAAADAHSPHLQLRAPAEMRLLHALLFAWGLMLVEAMETGRRCKYYRPHCLHRVRVL